MGTESHRHAGHATDCGIVDPGNWHARGQLRGGLLHLLDLSDDFIRLCTGGVIWNLYSLHANAIWCDRARDDAERGHRTGAWGAHGTYLRRELWHRCRPGGALRRPLCADDDANSDHG